MPKVAILVSDVSGVAVVNTRRALQNQGYTTDVVGITTATVESLSGYDCVVCPRFTVSHLDLAANLLQQLISQGKPVVLYPGAGGGSNGTPQIQMSSKLNLTGKVVVLPPSSDLSPSNQGFDSIKIENVAHPITRNYSIGNLIVYNRSSDGWYSSQGCIANGEPYVGTLLATGDPDDSRTRDLPCVIAIEKGTLDLLGNPIGSRIVISGVCYGNNTPYSTTGEQLLNRCVQWAIGQNVTPQITSISTSISTLVPRISIGQRISTLSTPLHLTLQQPNVVLGARVVQPPVLSLNLNTLPIVEPLDETIQPPAISIQISLSPATTKPGRVTVQVNVVSLDISLSEPALRHIPFSIYPILIGGDGRPLAVLDKVYDFYIQDQLLSSDAGEEILQFTLPGDDQKAKLLQTEMTVRAYNRDYVIRVVDDHRDQQGLLSRQVLAEATWYDLAAGEPIQPRTWKGVTAKTLLMDLLAGTDWGIGRVDPTQSADFALNEATNRLVCLRQAASLYGAELFFDTRFRLVHLMHRVGQERPDVLFSEGKNVQSINRKEDTRGLVTKLYAYGADGLSIVLEDYNYFDQRGLPRKVLVSTFSDERYTKASSLLERAKYELSLRSKPAVTYELSVVVDEHVWLGDRVWVYDPQLNVRDRFRVSQRKWYPLEPWKTKIQLEQPLPTLSGQLAHLINDLSEQETPEETAQNLIYDSSFENVDFYASEPGVYRVEYTSPLRGWIWTGSEPSVYFSGETYFNHINTIFGVVAGVVDGHFDWNLLLPSGRSIPNIYARQHIQADDSGGYNLSAYFSAYDETETDGQGTMVVFIMYFDESGQPIIRKKWEKTFEISSLEKFKWKRYDLSIPISEVPEFEGPFIIMFESTTPYLVDGVMFVPQPEPTLYLPTETHFKSGNIL